MVAKAIMSVNKQQCFHISCCCDLPIWGKLNFKAWKIKYYLSFFVVSHVMRVSLQANFHTHQVEVDFSATVHRAVM